MRINTVVGRMAAAVVGGAVLTGIGAGTAFAAPAHTAATAPTAISAAHATTAGPQAPSKPGHPGLVTYYTDFYLYNNTPFVWTLDPSLTHSQQKRLPGVGEFAPSPWVNGPPPQQIQPGEAIGMAKLAPSGDPRNIRAGQDVWLSYTFADLDNARHMMQLRATDLDQMLSYSYDWDAKTSQWVEGHEFFYTGFQPNAERNSVGAFMKKPVEVTIDAKTDPKGAASAVSHFNDPGVGNQKYTKVGEPFVTYTDFVQGSAKLINATSAEAELKMESETTNLQYNTLSEEISVEVEWELEKIAGASIKTSIDGSEKWTHGTSAATGDSVPVPPGRVAWFKKANRVENVTGNFDFTLYNGLITYHIKNVTVSLPGLGNNLEAGTTFMPHTETPGNNLPVPPKDDPAAGKG